MPSKTNAEHERYPAKTTAFRIRTQMTKANFKQFSEPFALQVCKKPTV